MASFVPVCLVTAVIFDSMLCVAASVTGCTEVDHCVKEGDSGGSFAQPDMVKRSVLVDHVEEDQQVDNMNLQSSLTHKNGKILVDDGEDHQVNHANLQESLTNFVQAVQGHVQDLQAISQDSQEDVQDDVQDLQVSRAKRQQDGEDIRDERWDCTLSMYPRQKDCWAADVKQKCHGTNAQWAYDQVNGAGGNTKKAWQMYERMVANLCKKTAEKWDCTQSWHKGQKDCWAATAKEKCHGTNAQWAYDQVNGAGGNTKKAWQMYERIVANLCKKTAEKWDCTLSVHPGQKDCWAADVKQKCHAKGQAANAQWAYDQVNGAGGNAKKAWQIYGDIVADDCTKS